LTAEKPIAGSCGAEKYSLWLFSCGGLLIALSMVVGLWIYLSAQSAPARRVQGPLKVASLDGCADQYVLGLVPRAQIVAVSDRAGLEDSYFRDRAVNLRRAQPRLETILALDPDVVVRTWGGDFNLIKALEKHHIRIVNINDITNYDQAKPELFRIATELGQQASAGIEGHRFDQAMAAIQPVGAGRTALYYTPGGYSAGPDTMIGDMLQRLGFKLETQNKGFFYLSPEVLLSMKPDIFALGFYDDRYAMRRVPGRNPLVRARIAASPNFTLPRQAIGCSGWFTAYDLKELSQSALTGSGGEMAVPR
jgi:iron complex transport system substrate-binding protein